MEQPKFFTSNEVAELLRKDPSTVTRWCRPGGQLAQVAIQVGRGWRIPRSAVLDLIDPSRHGREAVA